MELQISKHSEKFIRAQVQSGHYPSADQVVEEALRLLERREEPTPTTLPLTEDVFRQKLLELGLMSQLPQSCDDDDHPDDQPVPIQGEPLSATVMSERR